MKKTIIIGMLLCVSCATPASFVMRVSYTKRGSKDICKVESTNCKGSLDLDNDTCGDIYAEVISRCVRPKTK